LLIERMETSPTLRRWLAVAVMVLLSCSLLAIRASTSHAATHTVEMKDFTFQPVDVTVSVGDTVTWVNRDTEPHAPQGGDFNSPDVQTGGTFSHTFTEAGDVPYICRIHTYMSGTVHVVNGPAPTTTTTAAPTTTTMGSTTTTTPSGGSTTTTVPSGSSSSEFQEVPDDPSGRMPPGRTSPTSSSPSTTTSTTTPGSSTTSTTAPPSDGFQEVPDDPSGGATPGKAATGKTVSTSSPAGTSLGDGTYLAPHTNDDGTKVFHLTMAPTTIETEPGVTKQAYAFNGIVPGPTLRVNEGDRIRVIVDNDLPFATGVHWHGMILPNDQDGIPELTQPPIEPGERHTYEFDAIAPGTHWYHTHSSGRHIGKGLYGAFEVVPKTGDIRADRDYTIEIGDTDLGFVFNGKSFPATTPLVTKVGEKVHLRIINAGDQVHAIHLHGIPFQVLAQDGNPLPVPQKMDTLTVAPAQTYDLLFSEVNPGKWLLHCHVFAHSHMTGDTMPPGDTGMTGMVTYLDVAPKSTALPGVPLAASASRSPQPRTGLAAWSGGMQDHLTLIVLAALLVIALRTGIGGRRSYLPLPLRKLPLRKDHE